MNELLRLSAAALAGRIRGREVSAEEVARAHLDRLQQVEPFIEAFLHVDPEHVLARARRIDGLLSNADPGPLAGVPVAVKDVLDVADVPTTCGSRILEGYRPPFTA